MSVPGPSSELPAGSWPGLIASADRPCLETRAKEVGDDAAASGLRAHVDVRDLGFRELKSVRWGGPPREHLLGQLGLRPRGRLLCGLADAGQPVVNLSSG